MAHIVCMTGGLTGILNASFALVKQLEQAGHRVTYASPAQLREPVTAQGIPYVQLDTWVIQAGEPSMGRWQKWRTLRERQQQAVDALGVQNFVQTIRELAPDLLLIDMEMHPHIMAAVTGQFSVALLCQFLSIWKRPSLPPMHTSIVPGKGLSGQRLAIEWSWWRYSWRKWWEFQRECWRRMGIDRVSILRCYARQIGYPWRNQRDQWLVPYPHASLPILCFNALELDFPHDPHPSMNYVGPMVLENRQESMVEPATEAALVQLFEKHTSDERFLIYCGCSTFVKTDQHFLQKLIEAVSTRPQWDLVLGLGGKLSPRKLSDLPLNVHAFSWVPQLQVIQHADCVINNGGINSINECLYFGVPMLVYSLKHFDQDGDAARVAYHGLGIAGDIVQDQSAKIRQYIQALLSDQSYKQQAERMGEYCHRYGHRAARVVESLLDSQRVERDFLAVSNQRGGGVS
ncbi:glycosyl transferase, UDP-glucuronosyltransferase [Leptolyngbya sp. PCC 7375]|nr:glycosyl transferase, UDP-glucuronosyltransferase [Leptolyngbya sp. PCC 7375]